LRKPIVFFLGSLLLLSLPFIDGAQVAWEDNEGCSLTAGAGSAMQQQGQLFKSTGYPDLDAAMNDTVGLLRRAFGVNPAFFMFNDSASPNAFATPQPFERGFSDGSVVMGNTLITQQFQQSSASGSVINFSISVIMAHETAHILQFSKGEQLPTVLKELEADYMAGWFMSVLSQMPNGYVWRGAAAMQALRSFYGLGDYAFNSPNHHGTPAQRIAALQAGFNEMNMPVQRVFNDAHRYVTSLGISSSGSDGETPSSLTTRSSGNREGRAGSDDDSKSALCEVLSKYVESAKHNFSSMRGQPKDHDAYGSTYRAKIEPAGFEDCEVNIFPNLEPSLTCETQDDDLTGLFDKIKSCFQSRPTTHSSKSSTEEYEVVGPDGVSIRLRKTGGGIRLWVDAPSRD